MNRLRESGVTRPGTSPTHSSGLVDDWCIAAASWWRTRRKAAQARTAATTSAANLADHETDTIRQYAEAAHCG